MKTMWKWLIALVILIITGVLLTWSFLAGRAEMQAESLGDTPVTAPSRVAQTPSGPVISLSADEQKRLGLSTHLCAMETKSRLRSAYGFIEVDPAATIIIKSPITGYLKTDAQHRWPQIGEQRQTNDAIGVITPRHTTMESIDLQTRLAIARADVATLRADIEREKITNKRTRDLYEEYTLASRQSVEDSETRLKNLETRLAAALTTVDVLNHAIARTESTGPDSQITVRIPSEGTVTDLFVTPESVVDSGQAMLRIVDYHRLLVRLHIDSTDHHDPAQALVTRSDDSRTAHATLASRPETLPGTPGCVVLMRLDHPPEDWRPGQAVHAQLEDNNKPLAGVIIPRSAIIRYAGTSWVYQLNDDGTISRRHVQLDDQHADGWFQSGWQASSIIVAGAQGLLSEELKSSIQVGEGTPP